MHKFSIRVMHALGAVWQCPGRQSSSCPTQLPFSFLQLDAEAKMLSHGILDLNEALILLLLIIIMIIITVLLLLSS